VENSRVFECSGSPWGSSSNRGGLLERVLSSVPCRKSSTRKKTKGRPLPATHSSGSQGGICSCAPHSVEAEARRFHPFIQDLTKVSSSWPGGARFFGLGPKRRAKKKKKRGDGTFEKGYRQSGLDADGFVPTCVSSQFPVRPLPLTRTHEPPPSTENKPADFL